MRFIGNKENLIEVIYFELSSRNISGETFFDFFAGTANVGKYFKKKGYSVLSSDILYFSYILQKAYIENNKKPDFAQLINEIDCGKKSTLFCSPLDLVIKWLNNIEPIDGFIYENYSPLGTAKLDIPRMYFSDDNARKIDAIRIMIENWKKQQLITDYEYYILIACLIETVPFYANISGVYAAFHKQWDARAKKPLILRSIELVSNNVDNKAFNCNSIELLKNVDVDILYLDPPYNQRQYAPNYHLLETIAKYDYPAIKGVAGIRNYDAQKSNFCNPIKAIKELNEIASKAKYKYLVLSYNSEGIMKQNDIIDVLKKYGDVELVQFDYRRYKSNNNGLSKTKKLIKEQLYILEKKYG